MPAAVPEFVGSDFSSSPAGHRYRLYYSGWGQERNLAEKGAEENLSCLRDIAKSSSGFEEQARALQDRQRLLLAILPESSYVCVHARTSSPLAVGTGAEHPIENGLLFFDPHGLPYIPGSTFKGMLRRAAEELALFEADAHGWTLGLVWWFLGFDPTASYLNPDGQADSSWSEAYREHVQRHSGAQPSATFEWIASLPAVYERMKTMQCDLRTFLLGLQGAGEGARRNRDSLRVQGTWQCWDGFLMPPRMRVEIVNVHFRDYYQAGGTPHETGSPRPVYFLAVDVGVEVQFIVRNAERAGVLGAPAYSEWKTLAQSALERVFFQLGIGAKSSVGYGRFSTIVPEGSPGTAAPEATAPASRPPAPTSASREEAARAEEVWRCTVVYKPDTRTLEAQQGNKKAFASEQKTKELLDSCPGKIRDALRGSQRKVQARVTVFRQGNQFRIESLEEP